MELWASELIKGRGESGLLRKRALRNNRNAKLDSNDYMHNALLDTVLKKLIARDIKSSMLTMLANYFYDMQRLITNCFNMLKQWGYFFIIIGNPSYKGVPIRADEVLAQESEKLSFVRKDVLIARRINIVSQQSSIIEPKDKFYLRESIIVLTPPPPCDYSMPFVLLLFARLEKLRVML